MAREDLDSVVDEITDAEQVTDVEKEVTVPGGGGGLDELKDNSSRDVKPGPKNRFVRIITSKAGRILIPLAILLVAIFAVPMTRYALVGAVVQKQTLINVVDDTTNKPVTDAKVSFGRADATTDKNGVAKIDRISVGDHLLKVEKKNYTTAEASYVVPIFGEASTTVRLKATGRVAVVTVTNVITGKPLEGALIKISDTTALTDQKGVANVALAIRNAEQTGTVSVEGFSEQQFTVSTKEMTPTSKVALVPKGKLYFLSNRSGTYDVMSATLDGEDQAVVLKGTGKELANELTLQASPDRAYLAYYARREGNDAALHMINSNSGDVATIDSSVSLGMIGWIGSTYYYSMYNYNAANNVSGRMKLMAYDAETKQKTQVDASAAEGEPWNAAELSLSGRFQIAGDRLYYAKCWYYPQALPSETPRKASFMVVKDGETKANSLKDINQTASASCDTIATKPNLVYFNMMYQNEGNETKAYKFELGKSVEETSLSIGELYNNTITYLSSPQGTQTFWTETRDGKKVSFIGNSNGENAKQVGQADYTAYGWFGDGYVLYSKGGSELFVAEAGAKLDGSHKVTDYFSAPTGPGW